MNQVEIVLEGEFIYGQTASQFKNQLAQAELKPVVVYLNSPGGDVVEAYEMLAALDNYTAQKTIAIEGVALSAASLLLCATGAFVTIVPHGLVMIHRCLLEVGKVNADSMRGDLATLNTCDLQIMKILQRRMKKSAAEIDAMLSRETWFSSTEALDVGLVDSIIRAENPKPLALGKFQSAPIKKPVTKADDLIEKLIRQLNGEPTDNVESLLKQIRDLLIRTVDPNELETLRAAYQQAWFQSAGNEIRTAGYGNFYSQRPSIAQLEREIFNQISGGR